ncbi:DsbA family protein [Pseudokineococcus marinus]|uniref:DsbA family protein n=1 Tax=Pseudokineococcus marinus TaxID=351215 RepID=A0A849BWC8_9ACTN|nr:DsbA family protein [Pseudokineococcus marinus]
MIYVFDAYCGWCYGFGPQVAELDRDPGVSIRVLPGSLFSGARSGPIGDYPHIPAANARISAATGVRFGPAYQALLADGQVSMDSDDAARGLLALQAVAGHGRDVELARAMQEAFYLDGLSLSEAETYRRIAQRLGLPADDVEAAYAHPRTHAAARDRQAQVAALGVAAYPTLLARTPAGLAQVGNPTATADEIRAALRDQ